MTSFSHGSEETLAELACGPFSPVNQPKILIGGLGMGFTLAAAVKTLRRGKAKFIVSELTSTIKGLKEIQHALKGGGILAVWSARTDKAFTKTLRKAGFDVSETSVPAAHKGRKTRCHTIWLARKQSY